MPKGGPAVPFKTRLWERVDMRGPQECWPWTGTLATNSGLPILHGWPESPSNKSARRFLYEWAWEPIPEGFVVVAGCDEQACVNPDHLFVVPRGTDPFVARGCQRGHGEEFQRYGITGKRWCQECERFRKAIARRKARVKVLLGSMKPTKPLLRSACRHGHSLLDPDNVYVDPDGYSLCRTCRAAARVRYQSMR